MLCSNSRSLSKEKSSKFPPPKEPQPGMEADGGAGVPRFVSVLSTILQRVAEANEPESMVRRKKKPLEMMTAFHGFFLKPSISVANYMERIYTYASCSPSCYIVAYIYLDRFASRHPRFSFDSFSVHRMVITSVVVAVKFMDDVCHSNAFFANVGGISIMEMNMMEMEFLFSLDFKLNVTPDDFHTYSLHLQNQMYIETPDVHDLLRSQCFFSDNSGDSSDTNGQNQQQEQLSV